MVVRKVEHDVGRVALAMNALEAVANEMMLIHPVAEWESQPTLRRWAYDPARTVSALGTPYRLGIDAI